MSVTSADLLALASGLKASGDEASRRASSSRAYYAGYHACLPVAVARQFVLPTNTGTHAALIRFLEDYTGRAQGETANVRTIGRLLRRGRRLRTIADYEIEKDFPANRAIESYRLGEAVLKQAARL